ncbi:putative regulator of G protein signaling superfamily [Rosellinia necatrix]|uniref:Putative regulator of G protein signaling superfamily n=1 Tax=Rosellinia necatrix TaxID=77044 RepID=A0A1W2TP81_ROSNE|nr:putative regulator of G protein signaling superfamily [Rosellinia necatrix]
MRLLPLNYRRPAYVDKEDFKRKTRDGELEERSNASLESGRSGPSLGIPDALTFDKIVNGGTCPPCTVRDFMNYLVYIEHAAENLQFFLWYRGYVKRFRAAPDSELALAPEWTQEMEEDTIARIQKDAASQAKKGLPTAIDIFKGTDFEKAREVHVESRDPFSTPPRSSAGDNSSFSGSQTTINSSQAADAFTAAGAKQPFTIQPFRAEIARVVATYVADGSPRQLNLSARERAAALRALAYTTHPSALQALAAGAETTLRRQAHPNFLRWAIRNGNPARVTFARGLGAGAMLLAAAAETALLVLSMAATAPLPPMGESDDGDRGRDAVLSRGWRALPAPLWIFGIATLIAAAKGMCVVLHGRHHRHVRPWELFAEDGDDEAGDDDFDPFGSSSSPSNSYEDEPWVVKYKCRPYVRRVFDREVWIQEPALRQIQDTIFLQSMLAALLGTGVLTAIFVAVPTGGSF